MLARLLRALIRHDTRPDAARSEPDAARRQLAEGDQLQRMRRFAQAFDVYERAARALERADPPEPVLHAALRLRAGMTRVRQWQLAEAKIQFAQAAALDPANRAAAGWLRLTDLIAESLPARRELLEAEDLALEAAAGPAGALRLLYFYVGMAEPHFSEACAMLRIGIAAARRVLADCEIVMLTDRHTRFPQDIAFDRVARFELPADAIAPARYIALERLLSSAPADPPKGHLIIEPDCLVQHDPGALFERDFDVALTVRHNFVEENLDHEPFNVGVMYVRGGREASAAAFFGACHRAIDRLSDRPIVRELYGERFRTWSSGQIAPAALIGWEPVISAVQAGRTNRMRVDGTVVAFPSSDGFNFPYDPGLDPALLERKFVVHYKGGRKAALLARREA